MSSLFRPDRHRCYVCGYTFEEIRPGGKWGFTVKKNGDATCYHFGYKIVQDPVLHKSNG